MVSGSSDTIWTVESAHPTAYGGYEGSALSQRAAKLAPTHQVWRPLPSLGHLGDAHRQNLCSHLLPLLELVKLTVHVQLEVDDLSIAERGDHLPLIGSGSDDRLTWPNLPLVDSLVGQNVPDSARVDLEESIVAELLNAEGGSGGDESSV